MNYFLLLQEKCQTMKEKLFLQTDEERCSYGELAEKVQMLVKAASLPKGEAVLIDAAEPLGQLTAFLAVQAAGSVPILLHHDLQAGDALRVQRENQLRWLLQENEQREFTLRDCGGESRLLPTEVCMGVLTSGSSGVPKVMLRTYESWAGFFPEQNRIFRVGEDTRLFFQGSLSFTGNLNTVLSLLYAGGTLLTSRRFRARTWLQVMNRFQADVLYMVPVKLKLLLQEKNWQLPGISMIFAGSQLLGTASARALREVFPRAEILLYYGASELNYITYLSYEEILENPQSVGRPFPGVGISVKDGFVYVDTPYHVYGVPRPFSVQDEGFLAEDGQLIFLGRRQGIINRGGLKINCLKIELQIRELPEVGEVVVLPFADEMRGSEMAACIVCTPGTEKQVQQSIRQTLLPAEQPRIFLFLPEIPLNDRGKPDGKKLQNYVENKRRKKNLIAVESASGIMEP